MYYSQSPTCGALPDAAALLAWTPGNDPINVCSVPLATRGAPASPTQIMITGPSYTPGFDADSQGGNNLDIFNFDYWQYVDVVVSNTGTVSIPPVGWMNACHRNGVQILGAIMLWATSGFDDFAPLFDEPQTTASQLAAIAGYYGFDGWFLDVESFYGGGTVNPTQFQLFLSSLTSAMQALSPDSLVVYYETISNTGVVDTYKDQLWTGNEMYFQSGQTTVANGMMCNYGWGPSQIKTSIETAKKLGRSPLDLWMEIYVPQTQLESYSLVQQCVDNGLSAGLYGASWPYQARTDEQPFAALQESFWGTGKYPQSCIAAVIPPRPVPSALPFCTTFNLGKGRSFQWLLHGTLANGGSDWNNLALQDIVTTYRNSVWTAAGNGNAFTLRSSYDLACDGGSSLLLASGNDAASGAFSVFDLYATTWSLGNGMQVSYTLQDAAEGSADLALGLMLDDGQTLLLLTPSPATAFSSLAIGDYTVVVVPPASVTTVSKPVQPPSSPPPPWTVRAYDIPSSYSANSVVEVLAVAVVLGASPLPAAAAQLYLGQFVVTEGNGLATAPASVTGLAVESQWEVSPLGFPTVNLELSWTAPATGTVRAYDVSYTANGQQVWLGRTTGTMFWVGQLAYTIPPQGSADMQLSVQVIGGNGVEQSVAEAASVDFTYTPPSS